MVPESGASVTEMLLVASSVWVVASGEEVVVFENPSVLSAVMWGSSVVLDSVLFAGPSVCVVF